MSISISYHIIYCFRRQECRGERECKVQTLMTPTTRFHLNLGNESTHKRNSLPHLHTKITFPLLQLVLQLSILIPVQHVITHTLHSLRLLLFLLLFRTINRFEWNQFVTLPDKSLRSRLTPSLIPLTRKQRSKQINMQYCTSIGFPSEFGWNPPSLSCFGEKEVHPISEHSRHSPEYSDWLPYSP